MQTAECRHLVYREVHLLANLGWVDLDFGSSTLCLVSVWADEKLAELVEQLGKMEEHPKSKSTQRRFAKRWTSLYLLCLLIKVQSSTLIDFSPSLFVVIAIVELRNAQNFNLWRRACSEQGRPRSMSHEKVIRI